jgi:hypothetical protein
MSQPAHEDDQIFHKQSRERSATSAKHAYRKNNHQAVTVGELLKKIQAEGSPIRLAWSEEEMNSQLPCDMEEWPTGVMPVVLVEEE